MRTSPRPPCSSRLLPRLGLSGALLLPLAGALLLGACRGVDTTGQRSDGFLAPDRSMVFDAMVEAMRAQGFTPDSSVSSESTGVVISRFKHEMAPFSGHGFREKATLRLEEVAGRANYYTVEANVLREYNDNLEQPSNPVVADWRDGVRVPELENLLKSRVEMRFIAPDASRQFRTERGLPSGKTGRLEGLSTDAPPAGGPEQLWPK